MKTYSIILALFLSLGFISCNNQSGNSENEINEDVNLGQTSEIDSVGVRPDGARIPVVVQMTDSINMPEELIRVIENTEGLNPDSILVKRRFVEDGTTFYELEFRMEGNRVETFTYDEEGKRRSEDLIKD